MAKILDSLIKKIKLLNEEINQTRTNLKGLESDLRGNKLSGSADFKKFADTAKNVKNEFDKLTDTTKKYNETKKQITNEIVRTTMEKAKEAVLHQKTNKQLRDEAKLRSAAKGSIDQHRAAISLLTQKRNALSTADANYNKKLDALNRSIDRHNQKIKQSGDAMMKQKMNIGNYSSALNSVKTGYMALVAGSAAVIGMFKKIGSAVGEVIGLYKTQATAEKSLQTALGYTSNALLTQASARQKLTEFGDEETIKAQAYLAMQGLTEDKILKLIPVIQDFAAAKGMDLASASDLVAKSVGSETNALKRYGITIEGAAGSTERTESAVAALNKMFGGQAESLAALDGGLKQFQNAMNDTKEILGGLASSIVGELLPAITEQLSVFNDTMKTFMDLRKQYKLNQEDTKSAAAMQKMFYLEIEKGNTKLVEDRKEQEKFLNVLAKIGVITKKNYDAMTTVFNDLVANQVIANEQQNLFKNNIDKTTKEVDKLSEAFFKLNEEAISQLTDKQINLNQLITGDIDYEQLQKQIDAYKEATSYLETAFEDEVESEFEVPIFTDEQLDAMKQKQDEIIENWKETVAKMKSIGQEFGEKTGAVIAGAILGDQDMIKQGLKDILISALRMAKNAAIGQIAVQAPAQPDAVASFGATAAARIAILTGLVEAGFQAAVIGINQFKEGGSMMLNGARHTDRSPGINLFGNNYAEAGERLSVFSRRATQLHNSDIIEFTNAINSGKIDEFYTQKVSEFSLGNTENLLGQIVANTRTGTKEIYENGRLIKKIRGNTTIYYQ